MLSVCTYPNLRGIIKLAFILCNVIDWGYSMKARYWSLAIVLILINYLIFATLFMRLVETDFTGRRATRMPEPTFTPAPAQPITIVPTPVPVTPVPTPTATRVLATPQINGGTTGDQTNSPEPAAQSVNGPELVSPGPVNIRSGPGLDYDVIGTLNTNTPMPIVGRNGDGSWWQIKIANDTLGWVSNSVVQASNTGNVPLAEASSPPQSSASVQVQPAADGPSPPPAKPQFQFEPTGWWGDTNYGLTRFLGDIKDVNGNPVNGMSVRASCGDYSVISNPSGPVGRGRYDESATWPPGFYDITVDTKPIPCLWILSVVDTDDGEFVKAVLSDSFPVQVTTEDSIIVANWRKNW